MGMGKEVVTSYFDPWAWVSEEQQFWEVEKGVRGGTIVPTDVIKKWDNVFVRSEMARSSFEPWALGMRKSGATV